MTLPFPSPSNVVPLPVGRQSSGASASASKIRRDGKSKAKPPTRSKIRSTDVASSDSRSGDSRSTVRDSRTASGDSRIASRVATTDPTQFSPPFDLIGELTRRREEYAGTEMFTLCFIPSYIRTCLDRVRARVVATNRIGLSVTAAAAIDYGITQIANHPDIKRTIEIRDKLHMLESVKAEDLQEVLDWVQSFPISVPNSGGASAVRRMNIHLSEHLRMRLAELAGDLGTSKSSLATLAIMHTLSEQTCVLPEHSEILREGVDGFVRRVKIRVVIAEVLVYLLCGKSGRGDGTANALTTIHRLLAEAGDTRDS